jgi:methylglutaconyl-CoA hydratase
MSTAPQDASPAAELEREAQEGPAAVLDVTPDGVAVVTLNRPRKKNAFGPDLILALSEIFETLHGADHVRVVFLRGRGGAFCSGADLAWMAETADWMEDDNRADAMRLAVMLRKLHDLPQLTVALVEGPAFGGGAGLVAACDAAVAVESAVFAFSEVRLGLTPATISPYVVRAIGPRAARALFASGRRFTAAEALRLGLVDEVAASAEALAAYMERTAADALAGAPGAVAAAKKLVEDVVGRAVDHGLLEHTAAAIAHRRVSPEGREGVRAFLERRKPSWTDQ